MKMKSLKKLGKVRKKDFKNFNRRIRYDE